MDKLNDEQFKALRGAFITNAKEGWRLATELAVSAITQYYDTSETGRIASVWETFAAAKGDKMLGAYEQAVYSITNVKFRQVDDLKKPVKCMVKGAAVTDWSTQLASLEKNGLQAKVKGIKTKSRATLLNSDGVKPEGKSAGGGIGVDDEVDDLMANATAEQKALVEAAQAKLNEHVKKVLAGEETGEGEGGEVTFDAGIPEGMNKEHQDVLIDLVDSFSQLSLKNPGKFASITKSVTNDVNGALKAAVRGVAGKKKNAA